MRHVLAILLLTTWSAFSFSGVVFVNDPLLSRLLLIKTAPAVPEKQCAIERGEDPGGGSASSCCSSQVCITSCATIKAGPVQEYCFDACMANKHTPLPGTHYVELPDPYSEVLSPPPDAV